MTGTQLYLRLLRYVRPYWRVFALSILGMLISAATEVALPAAAKPFLDGTFVHKDPVLMRWVPWLIVGAVRSCAVSARFWAVRQRWVGQRVDHGSARSRCSASCSRCRSGYFADNLSGNLISKFTFDVIQVAIAVTYVVTVLVRDSVTVVALARLSAVAELEAHADHLR